MCSVGGASHSISLIGGACIRLIKDCELDGIRLDAGRLSDMVVCSLVFSI